MKALQLINNSKAKLLLFKTAKHLAKEGTEEVSQQINNVGFGDHRYNLKISITATKIENDNE